MVPAKQLGQPCKCTKDCFNVIGLEKLKAINTDFWALGDHTLQTTFIQCHVTVAPPKRHYAALEANNRSCHRQYHLMVEGKLSHVCKNAFANALGLTLGRINNALNAQTPSGTVLPDGRGRHKNQPRIPEDRMQLVLDHINSFPTVFSHYARYVLNINFNIIT